MSVQLPTSHLDLFRKPILAHLATLMPDGSPHVTPIWIDYDGTHLLVNTVVGRVKEQNMRQRPQVALDIVDPDDPYRWLAIRGRVMEETSEGAVEHVDALALRYVGSKEFRSRRPDEKRVIFKIEPEHLVVWYGEQYLPSARQATGH
ncbi:PPOX class F420-dependent oxidoreductase [Ktedonosporobacter rubrisoli]|uniref:PPOX class F420-dependent oxidoreductase n=1 Tax=Ktedonosporobacter rubrisoli TaxID=2509675 RepID=A0A4P6JNM2_KTERU|nr:PPOX class F420-dependent oxidoreductase [Ktedonosporobacter rubrisoli]QBD76917.1 PPOX class F420-dependent oxidoreductase [Ktedonosporobacter rubrisoli]